MKVITTKPGFYGKLREVGEEFDVPEGAKASWFKADADEKHAEKKPVKGKGKAPEPAADLVGEDAEE